MMPRVYIYTLYVTQVAGTGWDLFARVPILRICLCGVHYRRGGDTEGTDSLLASNAPRLSDLPREGVASYSHY
jgi:hypothetical protein